MGPKQKSTTIFITPAILSDGTPSGHIQVQDIYPGETTKTNYTLTAGGYYIFAPAYGPKKTGYHTWNITYYGDNNFKPCNRSVTVFFYNTAPTGHFLITQSTASLGATVYFYGPAWFTKNSLTTLSSSFYGFINGTTSSASCGQSISGPTNTTATYTMGPYLGVAVVNAVTQVGSTFQTNTVNKLGVAIVLMNGAYPISVGPNNPGTGNIIDIYCPASF